MPPPLQYAPLLGAAATGLVDEEVALATKALVAVKGSYRPRLLFELGVGVGGALIAERMAPGTKRNAVEGASVGACALFGSMLVPVVKGVIKL